MSIFSPELQPVGLRLEISMTHSRNNIDSINEYPKRNQTMTRCEHSFFCRGVSGCESKNMCKPTCKPTKRYLPRFSFLEPLFVIFPPTRLLHTHQVTCCPSLLNLPVYATTAAAVFCRISKCNPGGRAGDKRSAFATAPWHSTSTFRNLHRRSAFSFFDQIRRASLFFT